ncbi:MAG: DUF6017 domain-containing protein [Subdoligranulum variabile]|nr:DUF6017 domain-containing protein [Subdoligranulum variabile]
MAVFRVERTSDYTVMSNYHLRDKRLSLKAKGLLSQMLSLPEDWDYTLAGLCYINRESKDAIRTAIRELEQAGYIRRRQTTDRGGKFAGNEYTIYERPQEPLPGEPSSEKPSSGNPTTGKPRSEKPTQRNIEKQKTDRQSTDSIPFRAAEPPEPKRIESNPVGQMEQYRALIRDNIQYPLLVAQNPDDADLIDEIVELMTETVCAHRRTTRVCGSDFPAEVVKSRLLKLDAEHIRFVLKCLNENTAKVKNIKQYLLATLYNAPVTINSYYSALVRHDLAEPAGKATAKEVVPMLAE